MRALTLWVLALCLSWAVWIVGLTCIASAAFGSTSVPPLDPIPLVICGVGQDAPKATAFRVDAHTLVTARHVVLKAPCTIAGEPMQVTYTSTQSEYAILRDDRPGRALHVDCGGFVQGRHYTALGHARGLEEVTPVDVLALGPARSVTVANSKGEENLIGMELLVGIFTTIPGQSGGPLVDKETGDAVGIVSGGNFEEGISSAVPLSITPLCKGKVA